MTLRDLLGIVKHGEVPPLEPTAQETVDLMLTLATLTKAERANILELVRAGYVFVDRDQDELASLVFLAIGEIDRERLAEKLGNGKDVADLIASIEERCRLTEEALGIDAESIRQPDHKKRIEALRRLTMRRLFGDDHGRRAD